MSHSDSKKKILLIDDNVDSAASLQQYLSGNDYEVSVQADSTMALARIQEEQPDIVIIEMDLKAESGLTICKLSRKDFHGGIFLLSHRVDELDQVLGLDMGADDFLSRAASPRLILAKCNAYLRRQLRSLDDDKKLPDDRLAFGPLVIDNSMREAWLNRKSIDLTSAEFDLLWLLASHAGEVLSREDIFSKLRGIEYDGQDRSVDVRVSRIRPKIGDDPVHPRRIKTVRSKGYLFVGEAK
ncbi:response regulator [Reinekea thalattae]|uniref:Response regulator n=1 Tax=Reinekea thalattae TaxID=2593301 RepID=A0A5C8ZA31_9GAMM|nr:response regulator [Reinekea thalattae]